jgi:hypothetical protein
MLEKKVHPGRQTAMGLRQKRGSAHPLACSLANPCSPARVHHRSPLLPDAQARVLFLYLESNKVSSPSQTGESVSRSGLLPAQYSFFARHVSSPMVSCQTG